MTTTLLERVKAFREFHAPPSANAMTPPGLELLDEVIAELSKAPPPSSVKMPHPKLNAGQRLVVSGFTHSQVADYGEAKAAEAREITRRTMPPLNDDLRAILGMICFQCINFAKALRAGGYEIATKAEDEQATVLHWLLGHYFAAGAGWRDSALQELKTMEEAAK